MGEIGLDTVSAKGINRPTFIGGSGERPGRWMVTLPGPLVLYPLREVM